MNRQTNTKTNMIGQIDKEKHKTGREGGGGGGGGKRNR